MDLNILPGVNSDEGGESPEVWEKSLASDNFTSGGPAWLTQMSGVARREPPTSRRP